MIKSKTVLTAFIFIGTLWSCKSSFPDASWIDKQWTAIEMSGIPIQISNSPQDAHLIFDAAQKIVNGNGSCNRIYGPYEIGKKNSLKFGNLASTMMTCQNQAFEDKLFDVLRTVQSYELSGDELWLKDNKKQVVLKFR